MERHCPSCKRETGTHDANCPYCGKALPATPGLEAAGDDELAQGRISSDAELIEEILALVQAGDKIHAIKVWREATHQGLAEAKEAVEALARGERVQVIKPAGPPAGELEALVLAMVRAGQTILAIKLYRERTGVGLADAKQAVDALAAKHGVKPPPGCGATAALFVAGLAVWAIWG